MSSNRPTRPERAAEDELRRERQPRDPRDQRDPRQQREIRQGRPVNAQRPQRPARDDREMVEERPLRQQRVQVSERETRPARPVRNVSSERPARQAPQMPSMPAINLSAMDFSAGAIQKGIAELVGTFLLVFLGVGGVLSGGLPGAFAFGMALLVIVYAIGHISGAHVNPAVSLGLALTGNLKWSLFPVYVIMQTLGAILAALVLKFTHTADHGLGVTHLANGVSTLRGFTIEMIGTAVLVFVVHAVATDKRAPAAVTGLAIGFALFCIAGMAGDLTGGSVNPARSLGPALVDTDFSDLWVYLVAPLIGGALGGLLYKVIGNDVFEDDPESHPVEALR